jgi:excisionase family DNA binding protein
VTNRERSTNLLDVIATGHPRSEGDATPDTPHLLTIEQLADRLQVPVGTIRKWRAQGSGGPPGIRIGKYVRYRPSDVDAWLNTLPGMP